MRSTFSRINLIVLSLVLSSSIFQSNVVAQDELSWPREIETLANTITIYQPQLESFKNNILEGRMAISIKPKDDEMLFCAAWFRAKMDTDLDTRIVTLDELSITKVHFPDLEDSAKIDQLSKLVEEETKTWNVEMSLDRLVASLDEVDDLNNPSVKLNNTPPDIYFRTTPTTLISIDGDPILKEIEDSGLEYVVNTPFFIVREKGKSTYYLKGGKFWYQSDEIVKGWKETSSVPKDINKLAEENLPEEEEDSVSASITEAPLLIVVTKPSEIILTDGDPEYQSLEKTTLLYVENTDSEIIMDVTSQEHYILLAGRWFHSKTLKDGDWHFSEPSELPEEFIKIPETSEMATVRASIPGTEEAKNSLLEQSIPQTATVDRKTASVEVKYDGDPEFNLVEGTEVSVAANTDKTVLLIKNKYYCIDEAIWFESDNPTGPWIVSDVRPDEVDELPPSSEVYNVKYVYIYDSTPEVVYVGYYPGYSYSYAYGGVVVYGTGYYYYPWYGHYYYPRAVTWGYGVHYSPYAGWGFHVGFRFGWVGWRYHRYHRAYWGARGYRHGYRHGYRRGARHGARAGYRAGYRAGQRNSSRPSHYNSRNVYNNRSSGVKQTRNSNRSQANMNRNNKARASSKPNNMYTDNRGNVHQRNKDGSWSQKSNKRSGSQTQSLAKQNPSGKRSNSNVNRSSSQQQLNKSHQSRSRGTSNYNRSRSSSRSGGRSGGGRRR